MPVTIIETETIGGVRLKKVYRHECTLGEFQHLYMRELCKAALRRMDEGKERFNFHDIENDASQVLEKKEGLIADYSWQVLSVGGLVPDDLLAAIRNYNLNPRHIAMKATDPLAEE